IASAIQRVIVGGHHSMTADVTLVDAKSGAIIVPYTAQSTMAFAGQGLAGAVVDAALFAEAIERVVNNYAEQYGGWLLRKLASATAYETWHAERKEDVSKIPTIRARAA